MRSTATLALFAASMFAQATRADEPKGDLAKLQGSWTGKVGPNKDIPITLKIKGNAAEYSGTRPDNGEEFKIKGEVKLDEKASPKAVDFVKFTTPDGQDMPDNLGLYKLDGDSFTVCAGGRGKERPAKFEAGESGPPTITTWTRLKEKAGEKPIEGDLGKFQGVWTSPIGTGDDVVITLTVKGNNYTARWEQDGNKIEMKGELRVNEKAGPKTIDFFKTERNDGQDSRDSLGIYAFEGDTIKLCVGNGGDERPTEFKRGDGGAPHLLNFTKKKD